MSAWFSNRDPIEQDIMSLWSVYDTLKSAYELNEHDDVMSVLNATITHLENNINMIRLSRNMMNILNDEQSQQTTLRRDIDGDDHEVTLTTTWDRYNTDGNSRSQHRMN